MNEEEEEEEEQQENQGDDGNYENGMMCNIDTFDQQDDSNVANDLEWADDAHIWAYIIHI